MKKAQIWDPYADFKKTVLPNGLSIYSTYCERPWMHVRICIHSGGLSDPKEKSGLAHFVEHMVSKRSGELSFNKMSRRVLNAGGSASFGSTSPYRTVFYFEIPLHGKYFKEMLNKFSEMLYFDLEPRYFEVEKKAILNEFRRYFPIRSRYYIDTRKYAFAYQGTRFHEYKDTIGSFETIEAIEMADVEKFFSEHYGPRNISIVAMGGLNHEDFVEMITSSYFSHDKKVIRNNIPQALESLPFPIVNEEIIHLSDAFPGSNFDISGFDSYALVPGIYSRKAVSMLRGILNKILLHKIREKSGSTYSPDVEWEFMGDTYDFRISILLEKGELSKFKDSVVMYSLEDARKKSYFYEQRRFHVRSYWINDETMEEICKSVEKDLVLHGRVISTQEELELVKRVSYEEYLGLVDYLLDKRRWWTMVTVP